jgi:putative endonuclease
MPDTRTLGAQGEDLGVSYLKKSGFKILEQNYRTVFGEIDIIAQDKDYLVFLEVKLRSSRDYGTPGEAINFYKKQRIIKSALSYIKAKNIRSQNIRFDVLEVSPRENGIELIKSAFEAPGYTI